MKINDIKIFKILYAIFLLAIFTTLSAIISNLFSQISPYLNLENMYDSDKVYIYNYTYQRRELYDEKDVLIYKIDFLKENDNYAIKIVMNKNAAKYGIAYDDLDTLYVIKSDLNLEENVLYSNNKDLKNAIYKDYSNIVFKNTIFNIEYDITYLYVDDSLTLEDSTLVITKKSNCNLSTFNDLNSRHTTYYAFDGDGFKNIIKSKFTFKISMVLVFAIAAIITLLFSLFNMFDNYIKIYKNEIIIKNVYYKTKRQLINEYTNKNYVFAIVFICLGLLLGFIIQKNYSLKYLLLSLLSFAVSYYLILRIVMTFKIKKINLMSDSRGM